MTGDEYEKYFGDEYVEMKGGNSDMVIYARLQASSHILTAKFMTCEVRVNKMTITRSMEGVLEGNPPFISFYLFEQEIQQSPRQYGRSVKVIYPQWKDGIIRIPPFRYEMEFLHHVEKNPPYGVGNGDYYGLVLIWFDYAPAADMSLADYINSITSQFDFFKLTSKMTEEEKSCLC